MSQDFYEITTGPVGFPITFSESSDWCRDVDTADQVLVEALIDAATDTIEERMNRVFVNRSLTGKFEGVCVSSWEKYAFIEIRRAPLVSVSEIRVDGDVLDSTEYEIKESPTFARILFPNGISYSDDVFPIEIDFVAGFGISTATPEDIKTAIKQTVLFWYENKGDVSTDKKQQLPFVTKALIKKRRIMNSYG